MMEDPMMGDLMTEERAMMTGMMMTETIIMGKDTTITTI